MSYIELIKMVGGVPVVVTATEAEHFKLTAEKLSAAITPRTKAILLNNPSNPTGMMYDREELEAIAADMVNPTEVRVLKGTSPADLVVNCAKEEGCDLIIMGSRGQGGVKGFLGSVSYAVTKESPMTVLIAKEGDCR